MPNPFFQFKQFTVWHDRCAMKVGTDGVLLGAWTEVSAANNVLDIGVGTGLVSLMIAQRCAACIVGVEIDPEAIRQARENIDRSLWKERISLEEIDFRQYRPEKRFDTIVSNPPYFEDSLTPPDKQRSLARHTSGLSFRDLLAGVSALLADDGQFTLIIPAQADSLLKKLAFSFDLFPIRQCWVQTKPESTPKRTLVTFSRKESSCISQTLVVELERHVYSPEYIELTKDFYLKM